MTEHQRPSGSCFWRGHDWSRWGERYSMPGYVRPVFQKRTCARCGKQQERMV